MIRITYWSIRMGIFVLATVTAAVILATVSGIVFTIMEWGLGSAAMALVLSFAIWILICHLAAMLYRRRDAHTGNRNGVASFGTRPVFFATLISAAGIGATFFPHVPNLSVYSLRPLGSWSAPLLFQALDDPEAGTEAMSELKGFPKALELFLPRLIASVEALQDFKPGKLEDSQKKWKMEEWNYPEFRAAWRAMDLMGRLGSDAADAVPVLIRDVHRESLLPRENTYGLGDWAFYTSGLEEYEAKVLDTGKSWQVLIRIGKPAVLSIAEALSKSDSTREVAILTTVLQYIGPDAREAVPVMVDLLGQWQGNDSKSVERVKLIQALDGIRADADAAVPLLIQSAKADLYRESVSAIVALGRVGSRQMEAVNFLTDVVESNGNNIIGEREYGSDQPSEYVYAAIGSLARMNSDCRERLIGFLDGEYGPTIARALAGTPGSISPAGLTALHQSLETAGEYDRLSYASAIGSLAGADDQVISVYIENLEHQDFLAVPLLEKLGPAARAAIPALVERLVKNETHFRWKILKALCAISPDPDTIRPAVIDLLRSDDFADDPPAELLQWLKPTGISDEEVVDALLAGMQSPGGHLDERVRMLTGLSAASRKALPDVRRLYLEGKIGSGTWESFLWSLSIWDTVRYSMIGKIVLFLVVCVACLPVECFVFRWRLRLPPMPSRNRHQVDF